MHESFGTKALCVLLCGGVETMRGENSCYSYDALFSTKGVKDF